MQVDVTFGVAPQPALGRMAGVSCALFMAFALCACGDVEGPRQEGVSGGPAQALTVSGEQTDSGSSDRATSLISRKAGQAESLPTLSAPKTQTYRATNVLDALKAAHRRYLGVIPVHLDADGNGVVNAEDAEIILRRAIEGSATYVDVGRTIEAYRLTLNSAAYYDYDTAYEFAQRHQLAAFHMDAIYRLEPGTMFRRARSEGVPPYGKPLPVGGAKVEGFALPFNGMIDVMGNPSRVNYPQDFDRSLARNMFVPDPYCALEPERIRFPSTYLGPLHLPEVRIPAAISEFERVVALKDAWGKPYGNFVPGCVRDPRELFSATVRRLKTLGADTVVLYPWTSFDSTPSRWTVLNPAQTRSSTMGDEDLEWAVGEAKRAGLSVIWRNQIQGFQDAQGRYLDFPVVSAENVLKSFDAIDDFLLERGAFLQRIGVDGVSLTPWYWTSFHDALPRDQFFSRTRQNIANLRRSGFSGRIIHDLVDGIVDDPYLSAEIYLFEAGVWANLSEAQAPLASIDELKSTFSGPIQAARASAAGRRLLWNASFASRADGFVNPALEETFCTAGYGIDGGMFSGDCLQDRKVTDFGLQARATQAFLETVFMSGGEDVGGVRVEYWMDDNLLPGSTFPNLGYSLRAKPAEQVIRKWFTR